MPIQLKKSWNLFKAELAEWIIKGNSIQTQAAEMDKAIDAWNSEVFKWLQGSFTSTNNRYAITFHNAGANNFTISGDHMDLKNQAYRLNGKIDGQLLKGKLVDAVAGKIVDFSTAEFIYEKITHHSLHLLS